MAPLTLRNKPERQTRARLGRPGKGLTASAALADTSPGALLRLDQSWQREVMTYYRSIGECWNPAQYFSRSMERIRFYPAIRNDRGLPEEVESGELLDLFRRIQSPSAAPGDLSELAGSYGRLQFLIGDGLLTVSEEDGDEVWEYLSPMEMRLNPRSDARRAQEYRRLRAPGVPPEELTEAPDDEFAPLTGEDVRVWRLWRRHPEFSQWADSPVRPVRELYEVLQRLTLAVGAEASSRAAQRGLLFIPEELSFGPSDPTQDENPEEDPLIREFQEAMARAIRSPGTAEAMAPFIMRAAGVTTTSGGAIPTANLIKWMALGPSERYMEGEMWDKVISRLAGSLDLPKEMMTGIEDVSHWCTDTETEIYTADGWKRHDQLSIGDEILTLNHVTGYSEWDRVWDIARFEVEDEPMLSLEGNCHSSLTTLNHRWPTVTRRFEQRRWRTSETLNENEFIITGAQCWDVPDDAIYPDALVELVAWIWTEGSVITRHGRLSPTIRIYQGTYVNAENISSIRSALNALYGRATDSAMPSTRRTPLKDSTPRWRERQRPDGRSTVFILNAAASAPLAACVPDKIVTREFIRSLTRSQLELFIETSIRGDGSQRSTQEILFQKNGTALKAIEFAAILLGRSLNSYAKRIKGFRDHEMHVVALHKRSRFGPKGRHKKTVKYTGTVWCPVTGNGTWLAKRAGHVFYTGNSAWFLDEVGFRQHTGPTVVRFCNDLAGAYLRPAAMNAGVPNADNVTVWFDASQAINHPDETGTARDAHDRLVISDAYYREKIGAPDDSQPTGDELERRVAIKLKEFPSDMQPEPQTGATPPTAGGRGGDVVKSAPQDGSEDRPPGNKPPTQAGPSMSAMIIGAAEMQIDRARELAGQRLIRRSQGCVDCREKTKNVPAGLVASALGPDTVRDVIDGHTTEASLVDGIAGTFAARLRAWRIDGGWPEQLGLMVEQHALRTLYEREVPPLPPGFHAACKKAAG